MSDLIAALTIFLRYANHRNPTQCGEDQLWVAVPVAEVCEDDRLTLAALSFRPSEDGEGFFSNRFGSC